jgi:tRNA/rRNA methyltransferase
MKVYCDLWRSCNLNAPMSRPMLDAIRIVLVEPAGPLNVGSIARVMKNFGLSHLVLVNPKCDHLGTEARLMAVRGADLLEAAQIVTSLPEALAGVQRAIGTTGIQPADPMPLEPPHQVLPWLLEADGSAQVPGAIVFGREDRGLTIDELHYTPRLLQVQTGDTYNSLNLAQTVALCCYELSVCQSRGLVSPAGPVVSAEPRATIDALDRFYHQLEAQLLAVGYLYPHTAPSRMKRFRRIYNRAQPTIEELHMLHGVLTQVNWALRQGAKDSQSASDREDETETKLT